ncbi:MAG: hypothetical protein WAK44_10355, partial [Trebonia sp.]|uniref:hypothetical protein n=1 Tax=Trebonia sp. TaxID=2767075 RepID=UPI003BAED5DC
ARPQRSEQRQIDLICISQLTSPRETMAAPNGGDACLFGHAASAICRHRMLSSPTVAGTGRPGGEGRKSQGPVVRARERPAGTCGRSPGPGS